MPRRKSGPAALFLVLLVPLGAGAEEPVPEAATAVGEDDRDGHPATPLVTALGDRLRPEGRFLVAVKGDGAQEFARQYSVEQARLGAIYEEELFRAEVEADLAEAAVLNDAYLQLRGGELARLTVGRFKQPFSATLLTSSWDDPVPRTRGLGGAMKDLGFGGRNLGVGAEGRFKPAGRLRVQAGVFQGSSYGDAAPAEDGYLRATAAPWKPLRFGVSLGRKGFLDGGTGDAIGADARLELYGFHTLLEVLRGTNQALDGRVSGATGTVSYRVGLTGELWAEPAVEAEQTVHEDGEPIRLIAGAVGLGIGERFQLRAGIERGSPSPGEAARTAVVFVAGVQP